MQYFSIVVPLYNKGPHVKRAIMSILNQTYKKFEIIVINDGSTDNGPNIVNTIKDKRIKIHNQENQGVSVARNQGISKSNYDLIAFLDADDEWKPLLLEKFKNMTNKYPNAGMIGAGYKEGRGEERKKVQFQHVPIKKGIIENYFQAAIIRNPTCASAVLIKKSVFDKVGGFPTNLKRGEDSFMWSKVALNYPVGFINESLAVRHYDTVNRSSSNLALLDDFPLLDYIKSSNLEIDKSTYYYVKEFTYQKYISRAIQSLKIGNKKRAKEFLLKSKDTKEFKTRHLKSKALSWLPNKIISLIYIFY